MFRPEGRLDPQNDSRQGRVCSLIVFRSAMCCDLGVSVSCVDLDKCDFANCECDWTKGGASERTSGQCMQG